MRCAKYATMNSSKQEGSNMGSTSFWQRDARQAIESSPLSGTQETDVTIIGGGITGISAALLPS